MWIYNVAKTHVINTNKVQKFKTQDGAKGTLVMADETILGVYKDKDEADAKLRWVLKELADTGEKVLIMPKA